MTTPDILGYRILEALGRGAMSTVWSAEHPEDGAVAIKVLDPSLGNHADLLARFGEEAFVLMHVKHPNIARVLGFRRDQLALILERVPGKPLGDEAMPLAKALPIMRQILDAISFSHAQDELHRDIRPSNVMVTPDGEARVIGFGMVKIFGQAVTLNHDFWSPEQIDGRLLDARSDVFSLGALFFQMLVGRRPFSSDERDVAPDPLQYDLPREIADVIARALYPEPARRQESVAVLRRELDEAALAVERRVAAERVQADSRKRAEWMVRSPDGAEVGPVSLELVERGLNVGRVPEDAVVALVGSDEWRPVRDVVVEEVAPVQSVREAVVARAVVQIEQPVVTEAAPVVTAPVVATPVLQAAAMTQLAPMGSFPYAPQYPVAAVDISYYPLNEPVDLPKQSIAPAVAALSATLALMVAATWFLVATLS